MQSIQCMSPPLIASPFSPRGYMHLHLPPLSPNERGRYVIDSDNAHPLGREWLIANLISHPGRMQQGRAAMAAHRAPEPLAHDVAGRAYRVYLGLPYNYRARGWPAGSLMAEKIKSL